MRRAHELPLPRERLLRARSRRCTGTSRARSRSPTCSRSCFLVAFAVGDAAAGACRARRAVLLGFFAALPARLPGRLLRPLATRTRSRSSAKGLVKWVIHFVFLAAAVVWLSRRGQRVLLADARLVLRRDRRQRGLRRRCSCSTRARGGNLDATRALADHRRREPDQHLRRGQRRERLPPERAHRRPEPPRDHADRPAARPDAALPAARAGAPLARGGSRRRSASCSSSRSATLSRSGLLGLGVGALILAVPVPALPALAAAARADRRGASRCSRAIVLSRRSLLHDGPQVARADERRLGDRALPGLQLHPARAAHRTRCSGSG